MNRIIWQTEDGKIYIGFSIGNYLMPVQCFETLVEFCGYVRSRQQELIQELDFLSYVFSNKSSNIAQYINSLSGIDNIGKVQYIS